MRPDKNPDVARYFEGLTPIDTADELLKATAGLLTETGWVQRENAVDDAGRPTGSTAANAARFSVSSAMVRTSWQTGLDRTRVMNTAMARLSDHVRRTHPRAGTFEAEEAEKRPTVRNLALIIGWNDDPDRTLDEIVSVLLEVAEGAACSAAHPRADAERVDHAGKPDTTTPPVEPLDPQDEGPNENAGTEAGAAETKTGTETETEIENATTKPTEREPLPVPGQLF